MIRPDTSKIIDCVFDYLDCFLRAISIILLASSIDIREESRCRRNFLLVTQRPD